jgi:hypothetical protein
MVPAAAAALEKYDTVAIGVFSEEYVRAKQILIHSLDLKQRFAPAPGYTPRPNERDHHIYPKNSQIFYCSDGLFGGFRIRSGRQQILFFPLSESRTAGILAQAGIDVKTSKNHVAEKAHRVVGIYDVSPHEVEAILLQNSIQNRVCRIKDLNGEVRVKISAEAFSHSEAIEMCDSLAGRLKAVFSKGIYGIDTPELSKLVVATVRGAKTFVSVADYGLARFLKAKLAACHDYAEAFVFCDTNLAMQCNQPTETIVKIAYEALEKENAPYGAAISNIIHSTKEHSEEYAVYLALARDENVFVRTITTDSLESANELPGRAASSLLEMILRTENAKGAPACLNNLKKDRITVLNNSVSAANFDEKGKRKHGWIAAAACTAAALVVSLIVAAFA